MPIVSQGNSVVVDVGAHDGLWIKSTGSAEVTVNQVYAGTPEVINVTTDTGRVGFYGEPVTVSIRAVSGNADYQDTPDNIYPLTSVQGGQQSDSSPLEIAQTVNQLIGAAGDSAASFGILPTNPDNGDNFIAAMTALSVSGGTLSLPKGVFYTSKQFEMPSNVTLQGAGKTKTIIKAIAQTVFPAVKAIDLPTFPSWRAKRYMVATASRGGNGIVQNIAIKDLSIDWSNCPADNGIGTDINTDVRSPCPLWIDSAQNVTIENVAILNGLETNFLVTESQRTTDPTYRGSNITISQSVGVTCEGVDVGSSQYRSIEVSANSQNLKFNKCNIVTSNPWRHSIEIFSGSGLAPGVWYGDLLKDIVFSECRFIANNWASNEPNRQFDIVSLHEGSGATFDNCYFWIETFKWDFVGVKIFNRAQNVKVTNCTFDWQGKLNTTTGVFDGIQSAYSTANNQSTAFFQIGDVADLAADKCKNVVIADNICRVKNTSGGSTKSVILDNPTSVLQECVSVSDNTFFIDQVTIGREMVRVAGTSFDFTDNTVLVDNSATANMVWVDIKDSDSTTRAVVKNNTVVSRGSEFNSDGGVVFTNKDRVQVYDNTVITQTGKKSPKATIPFAGKTFTPTIEGTGGNPTVVYSQQKGYYYETADVVNFYIDLIVTSYTGGSGQLRIGGLPFLPNGNEGSCSISKLSGVTYTGQIVAAHEAANNKVLVRQVGSGAAQATLNLGAFSASGFTIALAGSYVKG